MALKELLKKITPNFVFKLKQALYLRKFKNKNLSEIFIDIYNENHWGGKKGEFCSGSGTVNPNSTLYIGKLIEFIKEKKIESIVDLGCGDFRIMKPVLDNVPATFIGCDIVPDLIKHNNDNFATEKIHFKVVNLVDGELPDGELCLIRQVLQHLNNEQISIILKKLKKYKYVIITEHLPFENNIKYNLDKNAGPDIRLFKKSGVFIDKEPFNLKTKLFLAYREDFKAFNKIQKAEISSKLLIN